MRPFLICLFCSALLLSTPALADLDAGQAAYDRRDWVRAIAALRPLVETDDRAAYLLAKMYLDGNGVVPDSQQAMRLYRLSAAKGNTQAMVSIGAIYQGGVGYRRNFTLANIWFKRAADLGSQFGAFVYASSLFQGDTEGKSNIAPDPVGAYKWFRIAAAHGNLEKVKAAAVAAANATANRLTAEQIAKLDKEVAAWSAAEFETLGPMPAVTAE